MDTKQKFAVDTDKPFFLMRRKNEDNVMLCTGEIHDFRDLESIPLQAGATGQETFDTVSLIPFAQARERGFPVHDGQEAIRTMAIAETRHFSVEDVVGAIGNVTVTVDDLAFGTTDGEYADIIRRIITEEIGRGQGANFVIARRCSATLTGLTGEGVLSIFRSLLVNEFGTYWTFVYFDGVSYFIGVSPERHISARGGEVMMNPISGTFRKDPNATLAQNGAAFLDFLRDEKEIFELFMVSDEELKIMCEICDTGGSIVGPLLKEMSRLIHTEYLLVGQSDKPVTELLRRSMFAPTVTGSPVLSAFRVIERYEEESRGYYGATIALIGRDAQGGATLDAPITIRTIQVGRDGKAVARVGATLVRGSDPDTEVRETEVKIMGLLNAIRSAGKVLPKPERLLHSMDEETVQILLQKRNMFLSRFWFEPQSANYGVVAALRGKRITIVDAEDDFSNMLKRMVAHMGAQVKVVNFMRYEEDGADLLIAGPGPGDPTSATDPKMARMRDIITTRLASRAPLFGVCLSHQILAHSLGYRVVNKNVPFQGAQKLIDLFGEPERVGFYNAFVALADHEVQGVEAAFDADTREVHALRGEHFYSVQFHLESILTPRGYDLMRAILHRLLG